MKQLTLSSLRQFETRETNIPETRPGWTLLEVAGCAICRTDAKMWDAGHRDLVLPRVPGHEIVARDGDGRRFTLWPGSSCGTCQYCVSGRENLCSSMKITGFHNDGGFADHVQVPDTSLIPVPEELPSSIACFAEPSGCVFNALAPLDILPHHRVLVYGGGTVGMLAALAIKEKGASPLVIEKNEKKIEKLSPFLSAAGISCVKDTVDSEFDAVINACPDPIAFSLGVVKLAKGGRYSFFSGLSKNKHLETNLLNLLHYREASLSGAYGLTRKNLLEAMGFLVRQKKNIHQLIEEIIPLSRVPEVIPAVLAGEALKYIIDPSLQDRLPEETSVSGRETQKYDSSDATHPENEARFRDVLSRIAPVTHQLKAAARQKIDNKTKPLGALGTLEELAVQMSLIQGSLDPIIRSRALVVFAGDHGVTEEGVSAYPAEVTAQMVENFLNGGAAINVLCRHHDIHLSIVDMGVNKTLAPHQSLIDRKVRPGTRNFALEPAMTREEAIQALTAGMEVFFDLNSRTPVDIIGVGEMGIGNTTSASAIICTITGITPEQSTGRGTGVDNKGLEHKSEVIEKALVFHKPDPTDGIDILCKVGGYEIAGIAGAVLAAASEGSAVVLDGVISTAAGLIAFLLNPDIQGYLISGHRSVEQAQAAALARLNLTPVIDFDMRLGEGTGAALAINTVEAACAIMREMASFDDAGISTKKA